MSLETRITAVVQAIGADIKALQTAGPSGSAAPVLSNLLVYYGYPIAFQGLWSSASVISAIAGSYSHWIVGDTYQNPAHEEYATTQAIVAGVRALGVIVYGYVPTGLSTSGLSVAQMRTRVDQWVTVGVDGIFLDEFGFDYENTRTRQNNITNYVHGKGLPASYNSWTFADTACDTLSEVPYASNDWRYANFQTYNPTNLALPRLPGDSYLFENFCYSHLGPGDVYEVQERAVLINALNLSKGLKIWALGVLAESSPGIIDNALTGNLLKLSDITSYVAATAYIYDYSIVGIGGYSFGSGGTAITTVMPDLPVGAAAPLTESVTDYVTGVSSRVFGKVNITTKNLLQQLVTVDAADALTDAPAMATIATPISTPTLENPFDTNSIEGYHWAPAVYTTSGSTNSTLSTVSSISDYIPASNGTGYTNLNASHRLTSASETYSLAGIASGSRVLSRATGFIFEVAVDFELSVAGSSGFTGIGTAAMYGSFGTSESMAGVGWVSSDTLTSMSTIITSSSGVVVTPFSRTGIGGLAVGNRFYRAVMSCPPGGSIMTIDLYDETCRFYALKSYELNISAIGLTVPVGPYAYTGTNAQTSSVVMRVFTFNCVEYPTVSKGAVVAQTGTQNVFVGPNAPVFSGSGLWIQTGINGSDMTFWIEDGL